MQNSSKAKTVEMKIRQLHSTDFPFDGIVFRRLQSVPSGMSHSSLQEFIGRCSFLCSYVKVGIWSLAFDGG